MAIWTADEGRASSIKKLRWQRFKAIQQLDPQQDNCEIARLIAGYEFPWDMTKALEIALLRTFCVSSISELLNKTGEFAVRSQKRYDDTGLLISSIFKWGHDSEQGRAAIARMNGIHSHFPISNEDYLYVLSTFIYEPIRWIDRFGWRQLCEVEKQGLFYFWASIGEQMGMQKIPSTYAAFEQYNLSYEAAHFRYSAATQRVGEATVTLFLSWFPALLRPALKPWVYAMLDDGMLAAFGFPQPPALQRRLIEGLLRSRSHCLRYFPPRTQSWFYIDEPQRSYPKGYCLEDIGPPALIARLNRKQD